MINRKIITQYIIILFVITLFSCSKDDEKEALDTYTSNVTDVLQADGSDIIDKNGTKVFLKGVSFGNDFWYDTPSTTHHNEIDFQRVRNMGMNTIRFYLNYHFFEDDANPYNYKQTA